MLVFYSEFKFEFGLNLKIEIRKIGEKKKALSHWAKSP
jgi:hypothetical protein